MKNIQYHVMIFDDDITRVTTENFCSTIYNRIFNKFENIVFVLSI